MGRTKIKAKTFSQRFRNENEQNLSCGFCNKELPHDSIFIPISRTFTYEEYVEVGGVQVSKIETTMCLECLEKASNFVKGIVGSYPDPKEIPEEDRKCFDPKDLEQWVKTHEQQ